MFCSFENCVKEREEKERGKERGREREKGGKNGQECERREVCLIKKKGRKRVHKPPLFAFFAFHLPSSKRERGSFSLLLSPLCVKR